MDYIANQIDFMEKCGSVPLQMSHRSYYRFVDELQAVGIRIWEELGGKVEANRE